MSNNKQSSVGILEDFLLQRCVPIMDGVKWHEFKLVIEQAKAMHKDEIKIAHGTGRLDRHNDFSRTPEQYYNETFGRNK